MMWLLEKKLGKLMRDLHKSDEKKASEGALSYLHDNSDRFTDEEYEQALRSYHKINRKWLQQWRGARPSWLPVSLWIKLDAYVKANALH